MPSWYPDRYRQLLVRLREARKAAGLSQVAVADALGIRQKYISRIEMGDRRLDPVELQAFADLYGKPLTFFLE